MLDNGQMTFKDIEEQYKSWRGNIQKYDCYKTLKTIDKLFEELFINNNSQNSHWISVIMYIENRATIKVVFFRVYIRGEE